MIKPKLLVLALISLPFSAWAQNHSSGNIAEAMMNLNAAPLRGNVRETQTDLWTRMRRDFRLSEVNPAIVRRHENYFAGRAAYVNRTIERSRPYLYHILTEVEKRNMPTEVALLPFIESAFVTRARSPVGASGLWQFMPATGRQYGLLQNNFYDSRHDIYASTDAALNYLQYLHGLFNDWPLALAAYNWGEGNVSRAIARARSQGLEPSYENLRMPDETRNYVPKLLAVRNLIANPQAFNLNLPTIENKPYFQAVTVRNPIDIQAITRLADISYAEFSALNPSSKVDVFLPENGQRKLLLPVGVVTRFENRLRDTPPESLLSYDILHNAGNSSLSDIAERTGTHIDELRRINGLTRNSRGISRLLVAKGQASAALNDPIGNLLNRQSGVTDSGSPAAFAENVSQLKSALPEPAPAVAEQPSINIHTALTQPVSETQAIPAPHNAQAENTESSHSDITTVTTNTDPLLDLIRRISNQTATAGQMQHNDTPNNVQSAATAETAPAATAETAPAATANNRRSTNAASPARSNRNTSQPRTVSHRVKAGESLIQIARRYQTDVAEIKRRNNLRSDNIRPGQILRLDNPQNTATAAPPRRQNSTATANASQRNSRNSNRQRDTAYTVRNGDTLAAIARRHNLSINEIKRQNNLRNDRLQPGQRLRIPRK